MRGPPERAISSADIETAAPAAREPDQPTGIGRRLVTPTGRREANHIKPLSQNYPNCAPIEYQGLTDVGSNCISVGANENPGALAGAAGADIETSEFHCKGYADTTASASAVPLRGDWNCERWAWLEAVNAAPDLPPIAKCLASVTVTQAADHISGDCLWRNDRFAIALGVSVDTIKRAFRALIAAGWLIRQDGRGRGNIAVITFMTPVSWAPKSRTDKGRKPACKAKTTGCMTTLDTPVKQGGTAPFSGRGQKRKRVQHCMEKGAELHFPPIPPYKDTPNSLQKARGETGPRKPVLNLRAVAYHGSDRERGWNSWLTARGWPILAALGIKLSDVGGTGWEVPFRQPPAAENAIEVRIAGEWVSWAMAQSEVRRAAA